MVVLSLVGIILLPHMAWCVGKCWLLPATPSVLCCVVCSSVCGSVQQQEGLREHEKINHPGIPAYHR